jgi:WD40 repeat protein
MSASLVLLAALLSPGGDPSADPLPEGARARLGTARLRHASQIVEAVAFAPDGKTLVSGGQDGAVRVWDAADGRPLLRLQHADAGCVRAVAVSPDGKRIASVDQHATLFLWDAATGELLARRPAAAGDPRELAFLPGGRLLAASADGTVRVLVAAADGANPLREEANYTQEEGLYGLTLSRDGKTVATGGVRGGESWIVTVRDLGTGRRVARYKHKPCGATCLAFGPDGTLLAAGQQSPGTVDIRDAATGKLLRRLTCDPKEHWPVGVSPDGKRLVTAAGDGILRLWDLETGKEVRRLTGGPRGQVLRAAFSPDGTKLATVGWDRGVGLWDLTSGRDLSGGDDTRRGAVLALALSPDGKRLATAGGDGTFRLWDAGAGKQRAARTGVPEHVEAIAFTADARTAVVPAPKGGLLWRDLESGEEVRRAKGPEEEVGAVALSADGKTAATAASDTVRVWDATAGKERTAFRVSEGHKALRLALSPDGRTLAVADDSHALSLWALPSGRRLFEVGYGGERIGPIVFAPDGRRLVYAVNGIVIWLEVLTGQQRHAFDAGFAPFTALAFSPDGRLLAAGDDQGNVHVWVLATGIRRAPLAGHTGAVRALAFSGDGRTLASGSDDTTVLLWDVAPGGTVRRRDPDELRALLGNIGHEDPEHYYAVLRGCLGTPDTAVELLRRRVPPAPDDLDGKRVSRWIAELDDESFEVRQKATEELSRRLPSVEDALRRALDDQPSVEARRRIEELLSRAGGVTEETLTEVRAVETLERIGTPEARRALEELAAGGSAARRTREAKESLERLRPGP